MGSREGVGQVTEQAVVCGWSGDAHMGDARTTGLQALEATLCGVIIRAVTLLK